MLSCKKNKVIIYNFTPYFIDTIHIIKTISDFVAPDLNIPNAYPSQNISLDIAMMLLSLRLDH